MLTKTSRAMRLASSAQLVQRMARADEQRDQRSVALFRNLSCEG
ncbi:hypothetical protein [Haladaptatus sp. R4]|nr:hypothetical protein [Haladaptatus sp. R4]